jgi:heme A synthase
MNDTSTTGPKKRPIRWMWVLLAFFVFKGLIGAYTVTI